jgi:hypothetical protein
MRNISIDKESDVLAPHDYETLSPGILESKDIVQIFLHMGIIMPSLQADFT